MGPLRLPARPELAPTRLAWFDHDEIGQTGVVRDAKRPRLEEGNQIARRISRRTLPNR